MSTTQMVKIASIDRTGRHRKKVGNFLNLVNSIKAVGLLHPVVLRKDLKLVAGERRICAYERLGREEIEATITDKLDDATAFLRAEQDENTCRLEFSPTEAVAVGRALEQLERPKANERKKSGINQYSEPSGKLPGGSGGYTRDKVGAAVGMSGRTYDYAKAVVAAAEEDPETFQEIADEMDRTGKVKPAYNAVLAIKKNGQRASSSKSNGTAKIPVGVVRANEAIDCLKRIPINDEHRKRGFQIVTDWIRLNK